MKPVPRPPTTFAWPATRNHIYFADIGMKDDDGNPLGEKPFLVVSNNARNKALDDFLAVQITTTPKSGLATYVPLGKDDPLAGTALCDDIITIYRGDIKRCIGVMSPETMMRIGKALQHTFAL